MPMVWIRVDPKRRTRFHRGPGCPQLTKAPARGRDHPLVAVDLDEVGVRPCKTCYPDAPTITVFKGYCDWHQSVLPCVHNGGIQVIRKNGWRLRVWPDSPQMPAFRKRAS